MIIQEIFKWWAQKGGKIIENFDKIAKIYNIFIDLHFFSNLSGLLLWEKKLIIDIFTLYGQYISVKEDRNL